MSIILRVTDELHAQFKEYAQGHSTTMSKILVDYIYTLINKEEKDTRKRITVLLKTIDEEDLPDEEKNSVKKTALTKLYHCPYCGKDITGMSGSDRLNHLQNCENRRNR